VGGVSFGGPFPKETRHQEHPQKKATLLSLKKSSHPKKEGNNTHPSKEEKKSPP